ncbi:hypothetical protein Hanom_Chr16g01479261 [Helianthus anomalus]
MFESKLYEMPDRGGRVAMVVLPTDLDESDTLHMMLLLCKLLKYRFSDWSISTHFVGLNFISYVFEV